MRARVEIETTMFNPQQPRGPNEVGQRPLFPYSFEQGSRHVGKYLAQKVCGEGLIGFYTRVRIRLKDNSLFAVHGLMDLANNGGILKGLSGLNQSFVRKLHEQIFQFGYDLLRRKVPGDDDDRVGTDKEFLPHSAQVPGGDRFRRLDRAAGMVGKGMFAIEVTPQDQLSVIEDFILEGTQVGHLGVPFPLDGFLHKSRMKQRIP